MDQPLDLDDDFMKELMQIVSPATSDTKSSENDEDSVSSATSDSSTHSPRYDWYTDKSTVPTSATVKPRPKRVRKGRRSELLELRAQVDAYKQTLDSLLARKQDKSSIKEGNFYQRAAHRISLERRLAIRENSRLRSLTDQQMSTIKELQHSILSIMTSNRADEADLKTDNEDLWAQALFRQVSPLRSNPGPILRPPTLTSAARAYDKSKRRLEVDVGCTNGKSFVCVQLVDEQALPSNFFFAATHSWKLLAQSNAHERRNGLYRDFKANGNTLFGLVKLDCCIQQGGPGAQVTIHKFAEPHRVSFMWEMEPHACLSGCRAEHKGSLRFEPSPENPSQACICVSNVHFSPQPLEDGASNGMGAAVDSVISMYDNTIGLQCQAMVVSLHEQAR